MINKFVKTMYIRSHVNFSKEGISFEHSESWSTVIFGAFLSVASFKIFNSILKRRKK